ncbi:HrcA family transcriptional regulator, partial [Mycobacterium kansasii]
MPLGKRQVMAILVTDSGDVENQTFDVSEAVSGDQLEAVVRLINDQLVGLTLPEVLQKLRTDIPMKITNYMQSP